MSPRARGQRPSPLGTRREAVPTASLAVGDIGTSRVPRPPKGDGDADQGQGSEKGRGQDDSSDHRGRLRGRTAPSCRLSCLRSLFWGPSRPRVAPGDQTRGKPRSVAGRACRFFGPAPKPDTDRTVSVPVGLLMAPAPRKLRSGPPVRCLQDHTQTPNTHQPGRGNSRADLNNEGVSFDVHRHSTCKV